MKISLKAASIVICTLMLAALLQGCIKINLPNVNPTSAPVTDPTDAADATEAADTDAPEITDIPATPAPVENTPGSPDPEPTPAPSPEPTPAPTDNPAITPPDVSGGLTISAGKTVKIDIDCDGLEDEITLNSKQDDPYDEEIYYTIKIKLGSNPSNPYSYQTTGAGERTFIMDGDVNDNRLEVILQTFGVDEDWPEVHAFRVKESGGSVDHFRLDGYLVDRGGGTFVKDGNIKIGTFTDVFGTNTVTAKYIVNSKGFKCISNVYLFLGGETIYEDLSPHVIRDMPAYHVKGNGTMGDPFTIPVGTYLVPVRTDLKTFVYVKLDTGEYAFVKITISDADGWERAYIDGQPQDYYMDIPYAG